MSRGGTCWEGNWGKWRSWPAVTCGGSGGAVQPVTATTATPSSTAADRGRAVLRRGGMGGFGGRFRLRLKFVAEAGLPSGTVFFVVDDLAAIVVIEGREGFVGDVVALQVEG